MQFFPRTRDIVTSRVEELLAAATDPGLTIRLIVKDIEEALIETRSREARFLLEAREIRRKLLEAERLQSELTDKARRALAEEREDVCRGALSAKYESISEAAGLQQQVDIIEARAGAIAAEVGRLESVLAAARALQSAAASGQPSQ